MTVKRYSQNPLIQPKDVKPSRDDFEVACVFNCGVIRYKGDVLLLLRVAETVINDDPNVYLTPVFDQDKQSVVIKSFDRNDPTTDFSDSRFVLPAGARFLTSMSHFRVARSKDGIHFNIEDTPAMMPVNEYEMFGLEDPRITEIDGTYYINYSCCAPVGITTCVASTRDFKTFQRHGVIFTPDNKDVAIFPERVGGKYYALSRPASDEYEKREIWLAESPDLVCWGNHRRIMPVTCDGWENGRIGCGAVPFRTDKGWLEIYHAADASNRYCLGAALFDLHQPWKVLARSKTPLMAPDAPYEKEGFYGNVVFTCGALCENGIVKIYYGAADTCVAGAEIALDDIFDHLQGRQ